MKDILGRAIAAHAVSNTADKLWIHNQYGPKEEMPIDTYFREEDDMPDLEWLALEQCTGKILDIGAGAGSHALFLQHEGKDVTAIDISPLAVEVMKQRGVGKAFIADIFTYNQGRFDTLLLLMNGIGLAGTMDGLKRLLNHLKTLLAPGGSILFDSSDVSYLYEDGELPADKYYGEIAYQYEYAGQKGEWFSWLYIDEKTLEDVTVELGFVMEVLMDDEYGQYLARLRAG
ncbi:class I SAM-dependent methyltransferase [Mucilaginibacter ginkgonis]|uniref:Class I SAM-dependent methyltransferase n=1 Tax=Mucilaginibacter ginkgonis TaxID=2682091 RepID=A0A6I4I3G6_9SPHI|nr:methyltransferase domain-containing protein [Mucilaginibacter ginkgonis]QQL49769.1 class I SAM-dependent methyltransferase [Mucilaginibacter ginkgonis]